jgi:hypothetical protein
MPVDLNFELKALSFSLSLTKHTHTHTHKLCWRPIVRWTTQFEGKLPPLGCEWDEIPGCLV